MTYKYDIGVYIVPKHIFQGQDWTTFKHFDMAKGWPVTTGPWKVVEASQPQKVFDRRELVGAVEAGADAADGAQHLAAEHRRTADRAGTDHQRSRHSLDMQPATFPTLFRGNPKITTHTEQKPPYGYVDWWPISLYVNNDVKPFDDKDVRWALSHYIDREQLIDVAFLGASQVSSLPMPPYPPLLPYFDAVKDLLAKYDTLAFDPKKGDALLAAKGFKKQDGFWIGPEGKKLAVASSVREFRRRDRAGDVGDAEAPRRRGEPGAAARFRRPVPEGPVCRFDLRPWRQHSRAVRMLRLYQGKSVAVPGAHLVNFRRWKNPEFDKITDEVYVTDPQKARMMELFRAAMEIWLPDLPDIQLVQNFHRIPMNTTYWKNWPTADNNYVNGASWHLTYPIVLWNLQPA